MLIASLEKEKIHEYFNLRKEIESCYRGIELIRADFYNRYSLVTHTTVEDVAIITVSIRPEIHVVNMVDSTAYLEKRIKELKKQYRYFQSFLDGLDREERNRLVARYQYSIPDEAEPIDEQVYLEILEIQEAINFQKGIAPENIIEVTTDNNNLAADFDAITDFLEV